MIGFKVTFSPQSFQQPLAIPFPLITLMRAKLFPFLPTLNAYRSDLRHHSLVGNEGTSLNNPGPSLPLLHHTLQHKDRRLSDEHCGAP